MKLIQKDEKIEEQDPDFLVKAFKHISERLKAVEENAKKAQTPDGKNLTAEQVMAIIDKVKRDPTLNVEVHPDIVFDVPVPSVTVTPSDVAVSAPVVNVENTVEQPNISVEAPIVTMPEVRVAAPIINTPRIKNITFEVLERDFDDNIVIFQATPIYED